MTHALSRSRTLMGNAPLPVDGKGGPTEHRGMLLHVTGGLAGVLRVVTMLHTRRYRVGDLAVEIREGEVVSEVRVTVVLIASEADLLLERLRRLPVVIGADNA